MARIRHREIADHIWMVLEALTVGDERAVLTNQIDEERLVVAISEIARAIRDDFSGLHARIMNILHRNKGDAGQMAHELDVLAELLDPDDDKFDR